MLLSDDTGSGLLLAYGIDPTTYVAGWKLVTDDLSEL
ncbi:MAG: hypothetical protein GEEBNDBF_02233 [bacterium]|nr:hypothetical protein [bacterium]